MCDFLPLCLVKSIRPATERLKKSLNVRYLLLLVVVAKASVSFDGSIDYGIDIAATHNQRANWFCKELPRPTTNDIEFRFCTDERRTNEDVYIEDVENVQ